MFTKIKDFFTDVASEMSKVSWPSTDELKESTIVVLSFSLVFAIAVYLFDTLFSQVLSFIF